MHRATGVLVRTAVLVAAVVMVGAPVSARAASLLAPTPYMGWNPYYAKLGSSDEATFQSVAESLISTGLQKAGYNIFWLDFGWASGARDSSGNLIIDANKWPQGMSEFTTWLHQHGFLAGIYTDAGTSGCNGKGVGSYDASAAAAGANPYSQDVNQFAAWGFDAIKVDFCGAGEQWLDQPPHDPRTLYRQFSQAVAATGRPMILNVCNFWTPGKINGTAPSYADSSWDTFSWAPQIAQSWRTDTDIGFAGNIQFQWVLRNLDQDATHPEAAGPPSAGIPWGHWNDPDYLGPGLGMSDTEAQSQFSMWAMLAAPLILGSDPRNLSSAEISMLKNPSVIAIDQDGLGAQGTLVAQAGGGQVWAKPLANGDAAVALLNRGTAPLTISTTPEQVGLPQATGYSVHDLWANTTTTTGAGDAISAVVPPHTVALYRVAATASNPSGAALTVTTSGSDPGTVRDSSGTISCPGTCQASYPPGTSVTLSATAPSAATFAGWRGGGCTGTGTCTVTINSNTNVTAAFVPELHTASVLVTGSGSVSDASGAISCPGTCSAAYSDGSTLTLAATPSPGSAFLGWSGAGCSGTGRCSVPVHADTAVSASFVQLHTLTVSRLGAGTGTVAAAGISCPGTCSAAYSDGSAVTLSATPGPGSAFTGWSGGGCSGTGPCTVSLNADTAVTATFVPLRTLSVSVIGAGAGTVTGPGISCPGTCNASYPQGTALTLATSPASGAQFGIWEGGGCPAFATSCTLNLNADARVTIAFDRATSGTAYVLNAGNNTVTPIDLATASTGRPIGGFHAPRAIAISPDGGIAYVVNTGNGSVTPIDLATNAREPAITGLRAPRAIAISPGGRTAYVLENGRRLIPIDLATNQAQPAITFGKRSGVGRWAASLAIAPSGKVAYLGTYGSGGTIAAVQLGTGKVAFVLRGFGDPAAMALAPDGRTAYVADPARGKVTAINLAWHRRIFADAFAGAHALAMTPDGKTVYAAGRGASGIEAINTATTTAQPTRIPGIANPGAVAIGPGGRAYVTGNDAVTPIDLATGAERQIITGFSAPTAIAVANPPPTNDSARLSPQIRRTRTGLSDSIRCLAANTPCTATETLTAIADSVVGRRTLRIAPGRSAVVVVELNTTGRALLKRLGRLAVVVSVAVDRRGQTDTVTARRLTIKPAR